LEDGCSANHAAAILLLLALTICMIVVDYRMDAGAPEIRLLAIGKNGECPPLVLPIANGLPVEQYDDMHHRETLLNEISWMEICDTSIINIITRIILHGYKFG
jgi:hypothetical protein